VHCLQVITEQNAHKIKARVIAEGANGPITPAADEILIANKQLVIPDIYCNSGNYDTNSGNYDANYNTFIVLFLIILVMSFLFCFLFLWQKLTT
jgi:hypothetical protein